MTAVATLEKHESSVMSVWMWQCLVDGDFPDEDGLCAFGDRAHFDDALKSLALHQAEKHACPTCGGCGYDVNPDGTDNGACLRCDGHGVWLKAAA